MRSTYLRALLFFSFVSTATSAHAQSNEGAQGLSATVTEGTTGAPTEAPVAPTTAPATTTFSTRVPRTQTLALGFSYNALFFHAQGQGTYRFQAPAVALDYFVGRRWGFALHLSVGFPITGGQNGGENFHGSLTTDYNSGRISTDTLLMAARRMPINDKLTFVWGVGVNVTSMRLLGTQYLAIEALSGGLGGMARVEYQLTRLLFVSGQLTFAVDPIDFIRHQDRITMTNPLTGAVSIGMKF